jgi:hypothetical protein
MPTLVVDNFKGSMTQFKIGDINSGLSDVIETFGNDPFSYPGNLTWVEDAVQIDADQAVITDLIMAGKERVENGILYVYAVGHTGRLYKIQVNDPTTYDPDYDNPVLLGTLSANSPTFTRGAFIEFFGATEKIYIGHDKGVTSINFDGTGEAFVGVLGSWTQDVPRAFNQFIGKLYIGNGENIAEIDSTGTVTTYAKLVPGFPSGTQVRDIDLNTDGTYLQVVVSRVALSDQTASTQDTTIVANSESYIFKWNGVDTGYTSYDTFPSVILNSNIMFGNHQYTFGYDGRGVAVFNPVDRIITSGLNSSYEQAPSPNAVSSDGNLVTWMTTLYFEDHLELSYGAYGTFNYEIGEGFWAPFGLVASGDETDIIRVPFQLTVSNFGRGISSNGYVDNIFGSSKIYFSTLETSGTPTVKYKFYRWSPVTTGQGVAIPEGVYETQMQVFSKKVTIKQIRVYGAPWTTGVSFRVELTGSGGSISGSSKDFTVGSTLTAGQDFAWFSPQMAPVFGVALRITNLGETNHVIYKVEIDYEIGGQ